MEKEKTALGELVYDLVCGNLDLTQLPEKERGLAASEFAPGSPCDLAYSQMLEAYSRLCSRLGQTRGEDADVEIIITQLRIIGRRVGLKMFEYGLALASGE